MAVFFARKFDNNLTKALQERGDCLLGKLTDSRAREAELDLVVELDNWKLVANPRSEEVLLVGWFRLFFGASLTPEDLLH